MSEFQWFSGLGVKAAKEAAAPLALEPAWDASDRLLLGEDAAAFRAFEAPTEPRYSLVGSLDAISATRRDVRSLFDEKDRERSVMADAIERQVGALSDLPSHAILDRGRLIGLWEFDTESGSIVWATFGVKPGPALRAAIEETETFVRDDLGDARSFSLDSPKSRAPRIASLRAMR
jgi:hypothetical protein